MAANVKPPETEKKTLKLSSLLMNSSDRIQPPSSSPEVEVTASMENKLIRPNQDQPLVNCPRCDSHQTKFCYYNNYSLSQPRYFCKSCRRYWTGNKKLSSTSEKPTTTHRRRLIPDGNSTTLNSLQLSPALVPDSVNPDFMESGGGGGGGGEYESAGPFPEMVAGAGMGNTLIPMG